MNEETSWKILFYYDNLLKFKFSNVTSLSCCLPSIGLRSCEIPAHVNRYMRKRNLDPMLL